MKCSGDRLEERKCCLNEDHSHLWTVSTGVKENYIHMRPTKELVSLDIGKCPGIEVKDRSWVRMTGEKKRSTFHRNRDIGGATGGRYKRTNSCELPHSGMFLQIEKAG